MKLEMESYTLVFSDKTGGLREFSTDRKNFICSSDKDFPLFTIRFRDSQGKITDVTALDGCDFSCRRETQGNTVNVVLDYRRIAGLAVSAKAVVVCPGNSGFSYWRLNVQNDMDMYIEWIDFPGVTVPNDLVAKGGTGRIVWPGNEGVLVEDTSIRESSWMRYIQPDYPSRGVAGIFPGAVPTQFMAYYCSEGGFYIGAHDYEGNVKCVEYYPVEDGVCLQFRLYPGAFSRGTFEMGYDMVLGVFEGDWHDAADIYRGWYSSRVKNRAVPISENSSLPEWYGDSPVVVAYPVRGKQDMDKMEPNKLFPYVNAKPHLQRLADKLGSKLMALLMHWEGTAPWAPPYVWPPYGGQEAFRQFAEELHDSGNLLGVYCSGLGWTEQSNLISEYNRKDQFDREHLENVMCMSPEGKLPYSAICTGQRRGYDMCPSQSFTTGTICDEVQSMINGGCDYIQAFDQNHGGTSYFCYSKNHGHPPAPGKWQTDAMKNLFAKLRGISEKAGKKVLFGCESVSAEPFIPGLLFSDARYNLNYFIGTPIPLYAYLYHEYVNNFMGNQVTANGIFENEKSPDNLLYRMAYSFTAGDMFTLVMTEDGDITWNWGISWDEKLPCQDSLLAFVRNANAWRRGAGKPYLHSGRMVKPIPAEGIPKNTIYLKTGRSLAVDSVLTSCWQSSTGSLGQVFANYSENPVSFSLLIPSSAGKKITLLKNPDGSQPEEVTPKSSGKIACEVGPLQSIMLVLD